MSDAPSLLYRFPKNSIVSGCVTRVTRSGAFLSFGDSEGVIGHIPSRELAWEYVDDPRHFLHQGQYIKAMVIGEDTVLNQVLLSRRLVLHDPWPAILNDYSVGSEYEGVVRNVNKFGAFIELRDGIEGLAHVSQIPKQEGSEQLIELWADDKVLVEILSIHREERRIALSLSSVIDRRDQRLAREPYMARKRGVVTIGERLGVRADPLAHTEVSAQAPEQDSRHVILVDDDEEFGELLVEWLTERGYEPNFVTTIEQARTLVMQSQYRLVLLDYHLNGGTSVELAELAAQRNPPPRIILLSDQPDLQLYQQQTSIPGLICWNKIAPLGELETLLHSIDNPSLHPQSPKSRVRPLVTPQQHLAESQQRSTTDEPTSDQLAHQLLTIALHPGRNDEHPSLAPIDQLCAAEVRHLIRVTGASAALACAVELGAQRVRIITHAGQGLTLREADLPELIFSPARDVCVRGDILRVPNIHQDLGRFRHLLPLGGFSSFLGVPVRAEGGESCLGLLLFHQSQDHFSELHEQLALISAGHLALKLERQNVLRIGLSTQQTLLAGSVSLGVMHELRNGIKKLEVPMYNIKQRLGELRRQHELFDYQTLLELGLPNDATGMVQQFEVIRQLLEQQLDFARPYHLGKVDFNDVVKNTVQILKREASQQKVKFAPKFDPNIPAIYSSRSLIQQILLNLALNAIYQMGKAKIRNGVLQVITEYHPNAAKPVRVLFRDSGPGIHAEHSERLFQYGFTTRSNEGGTGLGLYLSRMAARALGGEVSLCETFVGYGSTFALDLPLHLPEETDEHAR